MNISKISINDAHIKIDSLLNRISSDSLLYRKTMHLLLMPFSDPNSLIRNDSITQYLLEKQLVSHWYSNVEKTTIQSQLHLTLQNRVGFQSNDFYYITPEGISKKMYAIQAKYLIIFFYNPECHTCTKYHSALLESKIINSKLKENELKILAIYIGEDLDIWNFYQDEIPDTWISGRVFNELFYRNSIYDLNAMPTVYLLDKGKKVLLKDCINISIIENNIL